jgi:hypothetical protein
MTSVEDLYSDYTEEAASDEAKTFRRPFFKPEFGNNQIRVLPIPRDPTTRQPVRSNPWVVTHEHSVKFPTGFLRIGCPRLMGDGGPCALCAIADGFRQKVKAKDDPNDKMAQNFSVRLHAYIEIISRKQEDEPRGVLLWDAGKRIREELNRLRRDQLVGREDYTHPRKGTDLVLNKKKTGPKEVNVEYSLMFMRDPSPLAKTDAQMIDWLTNRVDFTDKLVIPDNELVKRRLQQFKDAVNHLRENPEAMEDQKRRGLPAAPDDDVPPGESPDGEQLGDGEFIMPDDLGDSNDIPF